MRYGRASLAVAAVAAAIAVPVAFAKGKPPTIGPGCKPMVSVILKGTLTNDPGLGATSFTMNVTQTNAHGKSLNGLAVTITVDANTKIRKQGLKTVDALAMNDRANVLLRRCKGDLPLSPATVGAVAAKRVIAQAAQA